MAGDCALKINSLCPQWKSVVHNKVTDKRTQGRKNKNKNNKKNHSGKLQILKSFEVKN